MSVWNISPEAFKLLQCSVEPVTPGDFMRLYSIAAKVTAEYPTTVSMNPANPWPQNHGTPREDDIVIEREGFCRTKDGEPVDTRLFGEAHPEFGKMGVVAVAGIYPNRVFALSSDGTNHWVTNSDDDRSITPEELDDLVVKLDLDNLVPFGKYSDRFLGSE